MSLDQTIPSGGAQNGSHVEQLPSQEPEVLFTISTVGNATDYMAKIVVKPKKELKSPFLVKRHLFLKRRPDPTILDELYRLTTDMNHPETSIWASSNGPFPIRLSHATIKKSVEQGKVMDRACLNIAVRNMAREDAENFMNTKCLGWRHYVDSNWMQSTKVPNNLRTAYSREATLYDPSGSHLVLIPVSDAGQWTLYAFNMCDKKLSILDSRRDASEGGDEDPARRHEETRKAVCAALDKTMDVDLSFLSWDYELPKVPRQQNSCDSGFFVFNFMRLWDGHRLIRWFSTETMELRKNFLAYILSSSNEHHPDIPANVSELIKRLPGDTRMDLELLKAARARNIVAFCKLIDPERSTSPQISINHQPAFCSCVLRERTSCLCYCFHFECTSSRRSDNQIMQSAAKSASSTDRGQPADDNTTDSVANNTCPLIRRVTADGSGVLHIAASFGDVRPVEAVLGPGRQQNEGGVAAAAAALLRAENNRGDRPLHHAAATGSRETTERIVEKAKQIMGESSEAAFAWFLRARNLDGQTCLHEAVRLGHRDVVEYLVWEDARCYARCCRVPNRSREVAQPLVQAVDNERISPLYLATTLLREEIVEALLAESVASVISPSYSGPAGKTALHAAVLLSKELSSTLVNWKPSLIRTPDESGSTPLHYLADGKYTDEASCISITELLLNKDPSSGYCEDSEGSLPIHVAAAYNTLGIIDQFVKMCPGCESSCNASGQTILHIAVQRGSYDIVRLVCSDVRFKMILNTKDNDGNTALHLAVQKGCRKTFGFLIGNRAVSVSIRNKKGYTPLDLAVLNKTSRWTYVTYWPGHQRWICNSLLAAGADYGTFRADHLPAGNIPAAATDQAADSQAFSDTLSKSAAVMATCAALLFNAALNMFLNADSVYRTSKNTTAATPQGVDQARLYLKVKKLSADSLSVSACAILLFAIAGFPILPGAIGRTVALILGLGVLVVSSMISLQALGERLDLSRVYGTGMGAFCLLLSLFYAVLCGDLAWKTARHARPLWARCGRRGLVGAVLNLRRARSHSAVPLLHVCALVEVLVLTCAILAWGVLIVTKSFPVSLWQLINK